MTDEEQEWLATLGFSEEDEWPPRRGPTTKELKQAFDKHTRTGMDGEALEPKGLRELWGSGALSMWCDDLEVSILFKQRGANCLCSRGVGLPNYGSCIYSHVELRRL